MLIVAFSLLAACATQPKKYRKKRGCDCPQWNMRSMPDGSPVRAILRGPGARFPTDGKAQPEGADQGRS
jgi:hypothetical protein